MAAPPGTPLSQWSEPAGTGASLDMARGVIQQNAEGEWLISGDLFSAQGYLAQDADGNTYALLNEYSLPDGYTRLTGLAVLPDSIIAY